MPFARSAQTRTRQAVSQWRVEGHSNEAVRRHQIWRATGLRVCLSICFAALFPWQGAVVSAQHSHCEYPRPIGCNLSPPPRACSYLQLCSTPVWQVADERCLDELDVWLLTLHTAIILDLTLASIHNQTVGRTLGAAKERGNRDRQAGRQAEGLVRPLTAASVGTQLVNRRRTNSWTEATIQPAELSDTGCTYGKRLHLPHLPRSQHQQCRPRWQLRAPGSKKQT